MKKYFSLIFLFFFFGANAQVTFVIESLPDSTPPEDVIYISGTFNEWDPGDPNYSLTKNNDDKWEITLDEANAGHTIQYKFTRGSWASVEKGPEMEEIPNRVFTYGNGETVYITIANWADVNPGMTTAADNVIIMDEEFEMPQLNRTRRIWLYLPPDYNTSDTSYPVIYMHDGQNLFDLYTSYAGEWEVDETLNSLYNRGHRVPIVVGIDHGYELRIDELTPWEHPEYGGGEGDEYLAFIVETLKPYIDSNYRTLPDRENTGIMGSSLGGLISTYGALKYQDVFSRSGPFSPAYWINYDSIWDFVAETGYQQEVKFYQNVGELEGDGYVDLMFQMRNSLIAIGFYDVISKVIPDAGHNEQTWREDFEEAYLWLFGDYADVEEPIVSTQSMYIYPNPATDKIKLLNANLIIVDRVEIMNSSGQIVFNRTYGSTLTDIDVSGLSAGYYIMKVYTNNSPSSLKLIVH